MRVLTFTSLYPNAMTPRHGIFVQNRMAYFDRISDTARKTIVPVPYCPVLGWLKASRFYRYKQIPHADITGKSPVYYPRYWTIPGTGLIDPARAMAAAARPVIADIYGSVADFDLIDGHYLYPDGVAACALARMYRKPLFLTARGSDVNYWMTRKKPCRRILEALDYATKIFCVSAALKDRLMAYGVAENKLVVLMNGVDRDLFHPDVALPESLPESPPEKPGYLLSVGNFVPLKGHAYILEALARLPGERLVLIGAGPAEKSLKALTEQYHIADRVSFVPPVAQAALPGWYRGAKFSILMSAMEGMPNVVLESLAVGTPVIASNVGGLSAVIGQENGILLPARNTQTLVQALKDGTGQAWDRKRISDSVAHLNWSDTAARLYDCFAAAL